ncbi:MAG: dinitrogenase iron-molybdenum cofactor [Clostridiales bacterium]|nr:dinitrogenase iron-molybdenum cofactor [Clostridiales bacterium]
MKIAIACEDKRVSQHFGYCEGFMIYDVKEGNIEDKKFVENPGHRPGFLPNFLKEGGVDIIIADGMGSNAQTIFDKNGIEVVVGAQGLCDDVIEKYIKGQLKSTESICHEHYLDQK